MPRIQGYERQVGAGGTINAPRLSADDITGGQQGVRALAEGVQNVGAMLYEKQEQREISDLTAKLAEAQASFSADWRNRLNTADPGDEEVASKFINDFDEYAQSLGEGATTVGAQKYFQNQTSNLKTHFTMTAMAGQAELAGVKAKDDYIKTVNSLSSSLLNDPSSFEVAKQTHGMGLEALVQSGRLPRSVAIQLQTQGEADLAKASVRGWIDLNPEDAKQQLTAGKWDTAFDADTKKQLFGEADQAIRGREAEQARLRAEQERIVKEQQEQTQNQFLEKMSKGTLSVKEVLKSNLDPFGSGSKEQFIQMFKANADRPLKTDPRTFSELFKQIHLPEGDPNKITDDAKLNQYVVDRKLTFEDLGRLRGEIQGKKTMQGQMESNLKSKFIASVTSSITNSVPAMGKMDNIGDKKLYEFQFFVEQKIDQQRKAGKSLEPLFDPTSAEYLGQYVPQYQRSAQEILRDMGSNMQMRPAGSGLAINPETSGTPPPRGTPPPKATRLPNESAADFLKRTKGQ